MGRLLLFENYDMPGVENQEINFGDEVMYNKFMKETERLNASEVLP